MWCVCGDGCFVDVLYHDVLCLTVVDGFVCLLYGGGGCRVDTLLFTMLVWRTVSNWAFTSWIMEQM